jgi:hypothetical protein
LKPVVCRRVEGRLAISIARKDVMATTRISAKKCCGLSCELSLGFHPSHFTHDWHVQPSCQRPNRIPPERRVFSPERIVRGLDRERVWRDESRPTRTILLSSKPLKVTVLPGRLSTYCIHSISTGNQPVESKCRDALNARQNTSPAPNCRNGRISAQAEAEDYGLRKDLYRRFLRKPHKPFEELSPRICQPRGRGQFQMPISSGLKH